jgi:hypothetical protein
MIAGALAVAALLGLVAAAALDVTDLAARPAYASTQGSSAALPLDPEFEKTVDLHPPTSRVEPAPPSTAARRPVARPSAAAPAPAATPAAVARPAAEPSPAPRPAPAVRLGKRCPTAGETAATADGKRAVCASGRGGQARWRLG